MIFSVIYNNWDYAAIGIPLSKYATGFLLEGTALPYISLQGVGHTVDERYSCFEQLEVCEANFLVYAEDKATIRSAFDGLDSTYVRNFDEFNSCAYGGDLVRQIEPQLWLGTFSLIIHYQRAFSPVDVVTPTKDSFEEAVYSRWEDTSLDVDGTDFFTDNFVLENQDFPYACIAQIAFSPESDTTCSRLDAGSFDIHLYNEDLISVEDKIDNIINAFNLSSLTVINKEFSIIEHTGHRYIELEPQVWRGEVSFDLVLEKEYV